MFSSLIITGARQVGKTRLLKEVYSDLPYVTLDDPVQFRTAAMDSGSFFNINPPPVVVDEIQYAPELFPQIKIIADSSREKGLFLMSGSQQFSLMNNVSESLAGRIGVLNLLGLSLRELGDIDFTQPFLPTREYIEARKKKDVPPASKDVWSIIQKGSLPEMQYPDTDWEMFYAAYVKTYIERDVRQLTNVGDELTFLRFMTAVAANSGMLLNNASISREIGVSQPTVERWISILRTSNIIYLLQPYYNNALKRAVKTPKLYFLDTGLACYLTGWNNPQVLERGAAAGKLFETLVVGEVIKSYTNAGREAPLYFYRDKEQNEIDLLIFENGTLYPIEIKKHANPQSDDISAFRYLDNIPGVVRGPGALICTYDRDASLGQNTRVMPLGLV